MHYANKATFLINYTQYSLRSDCQKVDELFVVSQAGHPFQQRCAHSAYSHARLKQECPSFLLLLDCVWQVWRQFPLALEFSEALLLRLAQEVYASNYGNFLCNNEQERWAQIIPIWHSSLLCTIQFNYALYLYCHFWSIRIKIVISFFFLLLTLDFWALMYRLLYYLFINFFCLG